MGFGIRIPPYNDDYLFVVPKTFGRLDVLNPRKPWRQYAHDDGAPSRAECGEFLPGGHICHGY